jgi:hypothetical protein
MKRILIAALLAAATPALAQNAATPAAPAANAAPRPAQAPIQIENPRYETVSVGIQVNAPAAKVWARVGKFCDIAEAEPALGPCRYLSGNGGPGTVRSIGNEVLVGGSKYSYTYARAPRANTLYNFYHGTLLVVPSSPGTSRLNHLVFLDTSMLDDAARKTALANLEARLTRSVANMKILAEGGKLPAQAPAPPAPVEQAPLQNPNPRYVTIPMQIDVNATADVVWSRIGHFCDIGRIGAVGFPTCQILGGADGEYGVLRSVGREVLVGRAMNSYTYSQQMRASGFYPLYHGTIEAREVTDKTSTLYWTLVYDNSNLTDDAAIQRDIASRRTRFMAMLQAVKSIAEGTIPPDTEDAPLMPYGVQ